MRVDLRLLPSVLFSVMFLLITGLATAAISGPDMGQRGISCRSLLCQQGSISKIYLPGDQIGAPEHGFSVLRIFSYPISRVQVVFGFWGFERGRVDHAMYTVQPPPVVMYDVFCHLLYRALF